MTKMPTPHSIRMADPLWLALCDAAHWFEDSRDLVLEDAFVTARIKRGSLLDDRSLEKHK